MLKLNEMNVDDFRAINPCIEVAESAIQKVLRLSPEDLKSKIQLRHYVEARMMFAKLCSNHVHTPYLIANYLNRHYSVLYYWLRKHDDLMESNRWYEESFSKVEKEFIESLTYNAK